MPLLKTISSTYKENFMDQYKHGTYGELVPTAPASEASTSCVVYVGTAPAHKIKGQSQMSDLFNTPLKINSLTTARKLLGYCEAAPFESYTLCEAVEIHFKNSLENVGPIYCINVLDPNLEGNYEEDDEGFELAVLKKQATFELGDYILDSLEIESVEETESEDGEAELKELTPLTEEDYRLEYDSTSDLVTLTLKGETTPSKVLVKGNVVKPDVIGADEIIGEVTEEGKKTGLQAIMNMYRKQDKVTSIVAAPGFSELPAVYQAMVKIATKVNGHWDAFVNADIPRKDINIRSKAWDWKEANGFTDGRTQVCWPPMKRANGKSFHASTIVTHAMQAADRDGGGIPYISASNRPVDTTGFDCDDGFEGLDLNEANELNARGITTFARVGGVWRVWGGHTAAYSYEDELKSEMDKNALDRTTQFVTGIRTLLHITNSFQEDNLDLIDQPMTSAIKDFIIQKEQSKLDALVSIGALVGAPKIYFSEDNSTEQIMGGNFVWDISATTNVPFKSGTVRLGYTDEGIYTLFGEEE